jgi:hypothetical protein
MPLRCAGCGQTFASGEAFDLHATGQRRATAGAPRRCRTEDEMQALGMGRIKPGYWRATKIRRVRA